MINNNNEQIKPQSAAMELIANYVHSYAELCIVDLPRNNHLTWHAHIHSCRATSQAVSFTYNYSYVTNVRIED